jgi:zinc transporter ZupT
MTLLLVFSLASLFGGPLLLDLLASRKHAYRVVDTFILVAVFGLILLHVLPESYELLGWPAILAALVGFVAPLAFGSFLNTGCHMHRSLISIASLGLIAHSLLDGMAIAGAHAHAQGTMLALAVVLHRLPEGAGVFRLARYSFGKNVALLALVALGFFTVAGFYFGTQILVLVPEPSLVLFQSLMAGILLHVIFHRRHLPHTHHEIEVRPNRRGEIFSSVVGAACGALLISLLALLHGPDAHADVATESASALEIHSHGH